MRRANIYYKDLLAGILTETDDGEYVFQYEAHYVDAHPDKLITFSMPVRQQRFVDKRLFPFFEGLIPEGWLLDIAAKNWKINQNDRMVLQNECRKINQWPFHGLIIPSCRQHTKKNISTYWRDDTLFCR